MSVRLSHVYVLTRHGLDRVTMDVSRLAGCRE